MTGIISDERAARIAAHLWATFRDTNRVIDILESFGLFIEDYGENNRDKLSVLYKVKENAADGIAEIYGINLNGPNFDSLYDALNDYATEDYYDGTDQMPAELSEKLAEIRNS